MLQRIQTLFIVGALISLCLVFAFPVWEGVFESKGQTLHPVYDVFVSGGMINGMVVQGVISLCVGMNGVAIFLYKNRPLQIKIVALNVFFIALLMGAFFLNIDAIHTTIGDKMVSEGYKLSFFLPIIALLLNIVAFRFIKKDERLIRSVDRIR